MDDYIEIACLIEKAFNEQASEELYNRYKKILNHFYKLAKEYRLKKNENISSSIKKIAGDLYSLEEQIHKLDKQHIYVFVDLSKLMSNGANSKSTLIWISPEEYLRLAGSVGNIENKLKNKDKQSVETIDKYYFDILRKHILPLQLELSEDNQFIVRHDGRHRAYAAALFPHDIKVPVELFWKTTPKNIDLSKVRRQDDPNNKKSKVKLPEDKKERLVHHNVKTLKIVLDKALDEMSDKKAWELYDIYTKKLEEFFKISEAYGRAKLKKSTKLDLIRFTIDLKNRGKELNVLQRQIRTLSPDRRFPFMDIGPFIKEGVHPTSKVIWIEPEKFLHLAADMGLMFEEPHMPSGKPDPDLVSVGHQLHRQTKGRISIPELWVNLKSNQVWGHEGRHRAYALNSSGWGRRKIPVVVHVQPRPENPENLVPFEGEVDPKKLKSQDIDIADSFNPDFEEQLDEKESNIEQNIEIAERAAEQAYQKEQAKERAKAHQRRAEERYMRRKYLPVKTEAVRGFKPEPIKRKPVVENTNEPLDPASGFEQMEENVKNLRKALLALIFS